MKRHTDSIEGLPRQISLTILFAINLFAIIVGVMLIVSGIAWLTIQTGLLTSDFWTDVRTLTLLVFVTSLVIAASVVIMANGLVFEPLHAMLDALKELAHGKFDVQVARRGKGSVKEIDDFADAFNATARELKSVEVLRSDFVDDFSHEFKTPIVSINGFAELLRDEATTDEERREYAGIIAHESKRLAAMASNILTLRQAESQEILEDAEALNLGEQVRRAAILMQEKWSHKRLNLALDVNDVTYTGNAALLERVWVNLIDNACKFSPDAGRVDITLHQTKAEGRRAVVFRIVNDGPAISPDTIEHIFERFYQADASHATLGCGLGLPLVRRIAELHGGTLMATSTPAGRTTFTLTLPLA